MIRLGILQSALAFIFIGRGSRTPFQVGLYENLQNKTKLTRITSGQTGSTGWPLGCQFCRSTEANAGGGKRMISMDEIIDECIVQAIFFSHDRSPPHLGHVPPRYAPRVASATRGCSGSAVAPRRPSTVMPSTSSSLHRAFFICSQPLDRSTKASNL